MQIFFFICSPSTVFLRLWVGPVFSQHTTREITRWYTWGGGYDGRVRRGVVEGLVACTDKRGAMRERVWEGRRTTRNTRREREGKGRDMGEQRNARDIEVNIGRI